MSITQMRHTAQLVHVLRMRGNIQRPPSAQDHERRNWFWEK